MDVTDEQIKNMLEKYKKEKTKRKERYQIQKMDQSFIKDNRQRSKDYYEKNKEKYKQKYQDNKEIKQAKNSYYYYNKTNQISNFKLNHQDKYNLLVKIDYFNDKNPSSSISTS